MGDIGTIGPPGKEVYTTHSLLAGNAAVATLNVCVCFFRVTQVHPARRVTKESREAQVILETMERRQGCVEYIRDL